MILYVPSVYEFDSLHLWISLNVRSHLVLVFQDEHDELEGAPGGEGHLVQDLLSAPVPPLQRVTHDTRRPLEPGVEVKCYVGPRLDAAATREIHLEPGRQRRGTRGHFE